MREALEFSAILRQPAHVPREEKIAYVDEVIELLDMQAYANAVVGEPGEGEGVHPSCISVHEADSVCRSQRRAAQGMSPLDPLFSCIILMDFDPEAPDNRCRTGSQASTSTLPG